MGGSRSHYIRRTVRNRLRGDVVRGLAATLIALTVGSGLSVLTLASGAAPASASTAGSTLSFGAAQVVSGTTYVNGISCPSASICEASGTTATSVAAITNGVPAAAQPVAGPTSLSGVSCSSVIDCYAVGDFNGGSLASEQAEVEPISGGTPGTSIPSNPSSQFSGVFCSSASGAACEAVGSTYVPGGSYQAVGAALGGDGTPGAYSAATDVQFLYAIACPPGSTDCEAVGQGLTVNGVYSATDVVVPFDDGMAGAATAVPGVSQLSAIACPNTTTCYAVGYAESTTSTGVIVPITDGVPGAVQTIAGTGDLTGIACPTADTCVAVGPATGGTTAVTITDGTPGTVQTDTGPQLHDIDCPSPTLCEAGGSIPGSPAEGAVAQINLVANQLTVSSLTLNPAHPTTADSSITASLTVRNDFSAAVTDVVPTLSSSDPTTLAISSGPTPANVATLGAGDSTTFTYQLTPLKAQTVSLQPGASALDPTSSPTTAPTVPALQVNLAGGDLTVALAANPSTIATTGSTTVTATLTNKTADTLTALTPSLAALPSAGLTIGSPTPTSLATLAPHATTTVTWPVTAIDPGTFSLTANVQVTDPTTGTETDSGTAQLPVSNLAIVVTTTGDEDLPPAAQQAGICDVDPNTDGNQCTLRAAIELANALGGSQSITFDIPGGGVPDIAPASALPSLQTSISIDGTTQTGGWVQLSGATEGGTAPGLTVAGGSAVIKGLVIDGWTNFGGVFVAGGSGTVIAGNRIGTDPTGTAAVPNRYGVYVSAPDVTVGGSNGTSLSSCTGDCNLLSGNNDGEGGDSKASGVYISPGGSATVSGNYIGTDVTGEHALANAVGVIDATTDGTGTSVIGGPTSVTGAAPGNIISGNANDALTLGGIDIVQGNIIGEDRSGSSTLQPPAPFNPPNQPGGTRLGIGVNATTSSVVTVGGMVQADRNVIGGFGNVGVVDATTLDNDEVGTNPLGTVVIPNGAGAIGVADVVNSLISGNTEDGVVGAALVTGDRIGTTADGQSALPNGVGVDGSQQVGGDRPAGSTTCSSPCNVISGNRYAAVSAATTVAGNFIGTNLAGTAAIPNGSSGPQGAAINLVEQLGGSSGVVARGVCDQACNLISGNNGIAVELGAVAEGSKVQGNLIGDDISLAALGNQQAAVYSQTSSGERDLIGGDGDVGNVIAHNGGAAVEISAGGAMSTVEGNAMIGNAGGGIIVDAGFGGTVPKSPTIATAVRSPGQVTVTGQVPDLLNPTQFSARVDLYASASCTVQPEGQVPLGNVTIGGISDGSFSVTTGAVAQSLGFIVATSTESGATSPFSECFQIATASTTTVRPGQPITVQSPGFSPDEQVSVTLHSTPVSLGTVRADGDGDVDAAVTIPSTTVPGSHELIFTGLTTGHTVIIPITVTAANGYDLVAADGGVFSFGDAPFYGSEGGTHLNSPIVGMASTPQGKGYWLVAADGGVFSFGDAPFYGSEGGTHLNSPIVGMASTPQGKGYWLVAADGGVFSFGDAPFYGSEGGTHLNSPIVGMASTPQGKGYWLVAADGGVFSFGDAPFYGSEGGTHLNSPIVGMASTPQGKGYWLVAADGGVFSFGDAPFYGSEGGTHLNSPIVGMASTPRGKGYWLVAADGGVFSFGDAPFSGSEGGTRLNGPVVGIGRPD